MIQSAETRLESATLVVRIPMRFQRRGGRKRIVAPDRSQLAPNSKPQPDGTLVKALARAWRWRRMLDGSVYASVSEIGEAGGSIRATSAESYAWRFWRRSWWKRFWMDR